MRSDRDNRTKGEKEIDDFLSQFETPVEDISTDIDRYLNNSGESAHVGRADRRSAQRRVNQALRNRKNRIERKERIPTSLNQNAETFLQHLIPMQVISNTDFSIKRIRTMSLAKANMSWLMVRRERTSLIR